MNNKVYQYIKENQIFKNGESVILGVSGGADSICLLYLLNDMKEQLGISLYVVHINHMIRGTEAKEDADFVQKVCEKLHIPFYLEEVDVPKIAKEQGLSEEEAGRNVRYEIFGKYLDKMNADKIAVAHQLNDNSETILFNLFRGTGIRGLTGISVKREQIVRPLLVISRTEIEEYLVGNKIAYRKDSTNNLTNYSRNKIRLSLIPYLKENINAKAEYNIVNAAENLKEIEDYISVETKNAYERYVFCNKNENQIFSCVLKQEAFTLHPAIKRGIIRKMIEEQAGGLKDVTKAHIDAVMKLCDNQVSKQVHLPYGLSAIRTYDGIMIVKQFKNEQQKVCELVLENETIYENSFVQITEETSNFQMRDVLDMIYTKWLDYDKINRLEIRNRLPGDYLVIDNQGSRKKLKDYMIDEKIPQEERDQLLLLADGNHIVWVIGHRISANYKVTESTKRIIRVDYKGRDYTPNQ